MCWFQGVSRCSPGQLVKQLLEAIFENRLGPERTLIDIRDCLQAAFLSIGHLWMLQTGPLNMMMKAICAWFWWVLRNKVVRGGTSCVCPNMTLFYISSSELSVYAKHLLTLVFRCWTIEGLHVWLEGLWGQFAEMLYYSFKNQCRANIWWDSTVGWRDQKPQMIEQYLVRLHSRKITTDECVPMGLKNSKKYEFALN